MHSAASAQRWIEVVDRSGERLRILTKTRRVRPGFDDVSPRHVETAFERAREPVLIEDVASIGRRDDAQRLESRSVVRPRLERLLSTPPELFSPIAMMTGPQGTVSLVESHHTLDSFKERHADHGVR